MLGNGGKTNMLAVAEVEYFNVDNNLIIFVSFPDLIDKLPERLFTNMRK